MHETQDRFDPWRLWPNLHHLPGQGSPPRPGVLIRGSGMQMMHDWKKFGVGSLTSKVHKPVLWQKKWWLWQQWRSYAVQSLWRISEIVGWLLFCVVVDIVACFYRRPLWKFRQIQSGLVNELLSSTTFSLQEASTLILQHVIFVLKKTTNAGPLEALLVIFGHSSSIFVCLFDSSSKSVKNDTIFARMRSGYHLQDSEGREKNNTLLRRI